MAPLDASLRAGLTNPQWAYLDMGIAREALHDVPGAYANYKKAADYDPKFQLAADQLKRFTVTPQTR